MLDETPTGHMKLTRRHACRSAITLISASALAGCGSSSDSTDGALAPGEAAEVGALEIAYTDHAMAEAIRPRTPTPNDGGADATPDGEGEGSEGAETASPITPRDGGSILGVEFRMENGSDAPETAPMPRPAPAIAKGELYVVVDQGEGEWEEGAMDPDEVDSLQIGPRIALNDRSVDSLAYLLGDRRAEVAPGETISGWAFYPIPEDADLAEVRVVLSGAEIEVAAGTSMIRWRLVDS